MLVPYYSPCHVMLLYFCILNLVNSYIVKSRFGSTALVMLTDASCFRGRQDTNTSQTSLDWGKGKRENFLAIKPNDILHRPAEINAPPTPLFPGGPDLFAGWYLNRHLGPNARFFKMPQCRVPLLLWRSKVMASSFRVFVKCKERAPFFNPGLASSPLLHNDLHPNV